MPLRAFLTGGSPQANTKMLRIAHGSHARITASRGCRVKLFPAADDTAPAPDPPEGVPRAAGIVVRALNAPAPAAASGGIADATSTPPRLVTGEAPETLLSRWPSEVEVQIVFGFQTRRNRIRQTIELIAAMTSTSSGPMKLETRNCGIAKLSPETRMAG